MLKKRNYAPVGIFDSGSGGLTVASALRERLPAENIIYLGDTARVPYGDKSPETILRFGCENAAFLAERGVKLIIVACNTVSALAMDGIRAFLEERGIDIPLLGVLEAGVETVIQRKIADIAVIGTRATVNSGAYARELRRKSPSITIRNIACPLFAPLVEEGLHRHKIADIAVDIYLKELKTNPPDALLLGCTHYPLMIDALKKYLPETVEIIDSAHAVADFAEKFLTEHSLKNPGLQNGTEEFYVTDSPGHFAQQAEIFTGRPVCNVTKVFIDTVTT